jgi:LPXTG-motif cell wall-anchored protein
MTVHVSSRRKVAGGLAAVAAGAIALVGAFPGTAGATSATGGGDLPFEHPCPEDGYYFRWGHEPPNDQESIPGTHDQDEAETESDAEFSVDISNVRVEGGHKTFDFVTSVPVSQVFVMGNPNSDPTGTLYPYEPAVTEGSGLASGDQWVKNVVFCPVGEETTTTTESTTTTTEATTTTTVEETTTTTAPPSSETTAPPSSVEPTTPSTEAPTTAPPTTQPIGEELPRTGNNTMPLVAGAGALLAAGVAAFVGRRYLQGRA